MKLLLLLALLSALPCAAQTPTCGLVADGTNKVPSDWATFTAPAKGSSYTDATFGCQVTRLTNGSTDFGASQFAVVTYYSTQTAMSSDDALIEVLRDDGNSYIIQNPKVTGANGTAVTIANMPARGSGNTFMWDRTNGNLFYYVSGSDNVLRSGTVTGRPSCLSGATCTVTSAAVHTFSEYSNLGMMDETRESIDGCHILLEGQASLGTAMDVFTWNVCNSTKSTPFTTACTGNVTDANDSCLHKMQIAGDNSIFYLLETANTENLWNGSSSICIQGCQVSTGTQHGDAGLDLAGNSVWISGADSDINTAQTNVCPYSSFFSLSKTLANTPTAGLVCLWDLSPSGLPSCCAVGGGGGQHIGYGGNSRVPWVTVSWFETSTAQYFGNDPSYAAPTSGTWPTYGGEIQYLNIGAVQSGSTNTNNGVYRLAYDRSRSVGTTASPGGDFYSSVLANSSFDGKYVVFNSNMAHGTTGCSGTWHTANECDDVYLLSGPNGSPLVSTAMAPAAPLFVQVVAH